MEKKGTVLIVEDEASIRNLLKMILEYDGFQVEEAVHGKEALDLLRKMPNLDLIVTDLMMPIMNGWELVEALGAEQLARNIPIVVVTAFPEKSKNMSCREVLKKPIDLDLFLTMIHRYCSKDYLNEPAIVSHSKIISSS